MEMSANARFIQTNRGAVPFLGWVSSTSNLNINSYVQALPSDVNQTVIQEELLNHQAIDRFDYETLYRKGLKIWSNSYDKPETVPAPFAAYLNLKASFGLWLSEITSNEALTIVNFYRSGSTLHTWGGNSGSMFTKNTSYYNPNDYTEWTMYFFGIECPTGRFLGWMTCSSRVNDTYGHMYGNNNVGGACISFTILTTDGVNINDFISDPDPNSGAGTSDPEGAQQETDFDLTSDDIPVPDMNDYLVTTNAGIVTLYKASQTRLELFSDELWSTNAWQSFLQFFGSPSDLVMGLGVIPFDVPAGEYRFPKIGGYTFTTSFQRVTKQFHEIDCGTLKISEYWGNYLDYSPYTRINIYLPYIGTRELDVDEVMGHTLFCKYHIDVYNGNCVAFLGIDGDSGEAVRYQFSGNCLQQLPISANSYDAMVAAGIQLATAAVGGIAAGATAAAGSAGVGAGENAAVNAAMGTSDMGLLNNLNSAGKAMESAEAGLVMAAKPRVEKNGSLGASIGQMSVQFPFITRELANQSLPENYMHYKGYPLNATATLGSQSGFTKVDDIRLNNLVATAPEVDEIYKLLKEGVII